MEAVFKCNFKIQLDFILTTSPRCLVEMSLRMEIYFWIASTQNFRLYLVYRSSTLAECHKEGH